MNIQMLNDHTGKTSNSRVLYMFCVVVYMGMWAWNSRDGLTPIDAEAVGLIGVMAFQKYGQVREELKSKVN